MPEQFGAFFLDAYMVPPTGAFTANAVVASNERTVLFSANAYITNTSLASLYVAAGNSSLPILLATSQDATLWTQRDPTTTQDIFDVIHGGGKWVLANNEADEDRIGVSTEAVSGWTLHELPDAIGSPVALAFSGTTYLAVTWMAEIYTSPDAETWTQQTSPLDGSDNTFYDVTWADGQFMAVGSLEFDTTGVIYTSPDGVTWTERTNPTGFVSLTCVAYGDGTWVVGNSTTSLVHKLATSTDGGDTWTTHTSPFSLNTSRPFNIAHGNGLFVAVGTNGMLATSPDGATWTERFSGFGTTINAVTYGREWVAVGNSGKIATSVDGETWAQVSPTSFGLSSIFTVAWAPITTRYLFASAVIKATSATKTFTADAVISGPYFRANAVIRQPDSGGTRTFTANAYFIYPTVDLISDRNRHDRGQWHFGEFPANLVTYDETTTLQERLAYLWTQLEAAESKNPTNFTLGALLLKARSASFTGNAFITVPAITGSFTADAIARYITPGSFTGNAITLRTIAASFAADAVIYSLTVEGSFTADAFIETGETLRSTQEVSEVVIFPTSAALRAEQTPVEAVLLPDPAMRSEQSVVEVLATGIPYFYANAIFLKTGLTGSFTADAEFTAPGTPMRVTQDAVDVVISPNPMGRTTQETAEAIISPTDQETRATQVVAEVIIKE